MFNLFPRSKWLRQEQDFAARMSALGPTRIFVTGATGFVGGAVAAALVGTPHFKQMLFLVRAKSAAEGAQRVRQSIARFSSSEVPPHVSESQIVVGDLNDPQAFLDARLDQVSHVIHGAAITSLANRQDIWAVNVDATLRLAERFSGVSSLQRFVYVGAAMACGVARGPLVTEALRLPVERAHLAPYTASKACAENQLRERFPDLPLVAVRPSMVIGHSWLGCKPSARNFWVLKVISELNRFVCPPSAYLDIVPVDYCARIIVELTLKKSLSFSAYHVSAGQQSSTMVAELLQAFQGLGGKGKVQAYMRVAEADLMNMALSLGERHAAQQKAGEAPHYEPFNTRLLCKALRLYGRFSRLNYVFDQQRVLGEGLQPAPSFLDYINLCDHSIRNLSLKSQMACDFE